MTNRTVVMYLEIGSFVSCLCGWILVCSTLPTEYWTFSEVGSIVLTTSNYYSNLWKDCISDTTGVSDCKDYPSMLGLPIYLHGCRALAVSAVVTGFFGGVLTLIGMKCTKIGGTEVINARVTFAGGITYLVSGCCGLITYTWWANKVVREYLDPHFRAQKFELGAALFVGWGGAILLLSGGTVQTYFSGKEGLPSSSLKKPRRPGTYASARTRRTYMLPPTSSRGPPLFYEGRRTRGARTTPLFSEGRKSQETRTTTYKVSRSFGRDSFV